MILTQQVVGGYNVLTRPSVSQQVRQYVSFAVFVSEYRGAKFREQLGFNGNMCTLLQQIHPIDFLEILTLLNLRIALLL